MNPPRVMHVREEPAALVGVLGGVVQFPCTVGVERGGVKDAGVGRAGRLVVVAIAGGVGARVAAGGVRRGMMLPTGNCTRIAIQGHTRIGGGCQLDWALTPRGPTATMQLTSPAQDLLLRLLGQFGNSLGTVWE